MTIPELDLPRVHLEPDEDLALARTMEAGWYAQHLLAAGRSDPLLPVVVEHGKRAAERLSWVGIRMALKYAKRTAYASGLPEDELFQDGCVAVAEAILRYDHARRNRFTTFVHEYLMREMTDGGRHRIGHPTVSRADRRAARQALRALEAEGMEDTATALESVVESLGLPRGAIQRGRIRHVSLEEATMSSIAPADDTGPGSLDFLELLLPRHRRVLQLRFGLQGQARTFDQIAVILRASPSTIARWEREALTAARRLLSEERTTTAAAYREETAAVAG